MTIIDNVLLKRVSDEAKISPRLRKNYNFHNSLEEKCQRFLNAVEPGTIVPIHRHKTKDETFVLLKGRVRVTTYDDNGNVLESYVVCQQEGIYGVNIPKGTWHSLECVTTDSVIFECKEGPYNPNNQDEVMDISVQGIQMMNPDSK